MNDPLPGPVENAVIPIPLLAISLSLGVNAATAAGKDAGSTYATPGFFQIIL